MLQYREKAYSTYYGNRKWKNIKFDMHNRKEHLDFNKYSYKIGHKIYHGPNQEVRNQYESDYEQHLLWMQLTE